MRRGAEARPSGDSDDNRSDDRERLTPTLNSCRESRNSMHGLITCDRSRRCEGEAKDENSPSRPGKTGDQLPNGDERKGGSKTDDYRTCRSCARARRGDTRSNPGRGGQSVDGEFEEKPGQRCKAGKTRDNADDDHGGGLREKVGRMRLHHHRGASRILARINSRPNRQSDQFLDRSGDGPSMIVLPLWWRSGYVPLRVRKS